MLGKDELTDELTIRLTIRVNAKLATLDIECGSNDGSKLPPDLHYEAPSMDVPLREVRAFCKHLLTQRAQRERIAGMEVIDLSGVFGSILGNGRTPAKEEVKN